MNTPLAHGKIIMVMINANPGHMILEIQSGQVTFGATVSKIGISICPTKNIVNQAGPSSALICPKHSLTYNVLPVLNRS